MSFRCVVCGKGPKSGNAVSHSRRATRRVFRPNLQKIRIILNGNVSREYVCTNCIKSGKVKKPAVAAASK
ncbi:MAG: 50S ribosomal protein L28 [Elusimicrobia bacterium CG1_02_37_114]|nr:MAG: 50S ribosomal protein L28 [Elusimicrobia bacterium CG1_02_37_114]PIV52764.1 MAG: 50S ribosomal protein L28 [Elusimicrobia bacterium CG02_land_8_20_14_3_00_37_13]PIZ12682.1 MAG: 50S ribosomal protein L28 [Elusimicrobia bacterium CG_4_10_14_0_8_um_filter_37_32]